TDAATSDPQTQIQSEKPAELRLWPTKVATFLVGELQETDFLNGAENGEQRCEAYYYVGAKRLIDGDAGTARTYFEKCTGTECKTSLEYTSAAAELRFSAQRGR